MTSCLTGLDKSVSKINTKIASYHTADSKPVKQEVNGIVILPPLVLPDYIHESLLNWSIKYYFTKDYIQSIISSIPVLLVNVRPGNTKGGIITVPLISCLTGLD